MNRISTGYLWMLAAALLAGCNAKGCDTSRWEQLFGRTSSDGALQPYQIESAKRDFCSKFYGLATFNAGQTSSSPPVEGESPNLPSLLQPHLSVIINGQSTEMNAYMLGTMRDYLSKIKWPAAAATGAGDSDYCHNAVLVLSENSLLLEFPERAIGKSPSRRRMVMVRFVSISSAWQKGPDRIWRLLQVHMSEGEKEMREDLAPPIANDVDANGNSTLESRETKNSDCKITWNAKAC